MSPFVQNVVVPLEGTWIEIIIDYSCLHDAVVVPLEGTWIEIHPPVSLYGVHQVVPLEGTWIEISLHLQINLPVTRRTP